MPLRCISDVSGGAPLNAPLSDGQRVVAHTGGTLYRLDLANGKILWSDGLCGYGYGIASLCFPKGASAPDAAAMQRIELDQRSHS